MTSRFTALRSSGKKFAPVRRAPGAGILWSGLLRGFEMSFSMEKGMKKQTMSSEEVAGQGESGAGAAGVSLWCIAA